MVPSTLMILTGFTIAFVVAGSPAPAVGRPKSELSDIKEYVVSDDELTKFRAEPGCSGPQFDAVQEALLIGSIHSMTDRRTHSPDAFTNSQAVAQAINKAAQVATDKGCTDIARRWWLNVIEHYVGSGYAAMRQRAQVGIDDLRANSQRYPPTNSKASPP